jgi:hypothetical protein
MNFWKIADVWHELIPWEIPGEWVEDLRRTFRGRR